MSFAAPGAPAARRRFRLAILAMALAALAIQLPIQLPIYDRWLPLFDEGFVTRSRPSYTRAHAGFEAPCLVAAAS